MLWVMLRPLLIAAIASGVLAGCGGGGSPSPTPPRAPGLSGLQRSIDAAHSVVSQSEQDARRAAATSAGG